MHKYIILPVLFFLNGGFGEIITSFPITCDSSCDDNSSDSPLCTVKKIQRVPYPGKDEVTANAPNELNGTWYIYAKPDGSKAVAFNLTWSQDGNSFLQLVSGFYISVLRTAASRDYKRQFNFNETLLRKSNFSRIREVVVNYPCFGKTGEDIRPDYVYSVSVKALPMYHESNEVQVQEKEIHINVPGCEDERISTIDFCQKLNESDEYDEGEYDDDDDDDEGDDFEDYDDYNDDDDDAENVSRKKDEDLFTPFIPYIVGGVVVVTIILGVVAFYGWKKRRRYKSYQACQQPKEDGKLLFLVNTWAEDAVYREAANLVASLFGDKHTFNLWNTTRSANPDVWTAEQLKRCDHVILICTPKGKQHYDKFCSSNEGSFVDTFVAGMHRHTGDTVRTLNATAIYFDKRASSCIPDNISEQIKCFQIMENFNKFVQHVGGKVVLAPNRSIVDRLKVQVERVRGIQSESNGSIHIIPNVTVL